MSAQRPDDVSRGFVTRLGRPPGAGVAGGYDELLRVTAMSVGHFSAPPGHDDRQQPHAEDEIYFVVAGRAMLDLDGIPVEVSAGSLAYVPAGLPHRFVDVVEHLSVLVMFAPPES